MSDNCDHNFGTFDDFGVKNDQKVSHSMILMSKYKGQHGEKKGQKIRAMPERNHFFSGRCSLRRNPGRLLRRRRRSTTSRLILD